LGNRAAFNFLDTGVRKLAEIRAWMRAVNGSECALKALVVDWHRMFRSERQGTSSEAQPGQSHVVATPGTFEKVEEVCVQTSGHL
jgi:hypothetical protein